MNKTLASCAPEEMHSIAESGATLELLNKISHDLSPQEFAFINPSERRQYTIQRFLDLIGGTQSSFSTQGGC